MSTPPALSLVDEAKAVAQYRPRSDVYRIAEMMPDALRAELAVALADPTVTAKRLATVLTGRGYRIGYASIQHFRNQGYTL